MVDSPIKKNTKACIITSHVMAASWRKRKMGTPILQTFRMGFQTSRKYKPGSTEYAPQWHAAYIPDEAHGHCWGAIHIATNVKPDEHCSTAAS